MKIYNPNVENKVAFNTLESGVVFQFDCVYYMKTKSRINECSDHNAVSLLSGLVMNFKPDTQVTPVEGEFIVKKV